MAIKRNPYLFNGPTVGQGIIAAAHPTSEIYPYDDVTKAKSDGIPGDMTTFFNHATAPISPDASNTPPPAGISFLIDGGDPVLPGTVGDPYEGFHFHSGHKFPVRGPVLPHSPSPTPSPTPTPISPSPIKGPTGGPIKTPGGGNPHGPSPLSRRRLWGSHEAGYNYWQHHKRQVVGPGSNAEETSSGTPSSHSHGYAGGTF